MLLLLFVGAEVFFSLVYLYFARLYLFCFLFVLYLVFYYFDGSERTGNRSWNSLRKLGFWDHFSATRFTGGTLDVVKSGQIYLFILNSNLTQMPLISGFGFHGSHFPGIDIRFVLPSPFFRVPLLREILLWSGAIEESEIPSQLQMGRSVAYCPYQPDDEEPTIKEEIFSIAIEKKISLIAIHVREETSRYVIRQPCAKSVWTLCCYPNIFGNRPPPRVYLDMGYPVSSETYDSPEKLREKMESQMAHLNGTVI